jgi:hypothetical protein
VVTATSNVSATFFAVIVLQYSGLLSSCADTGANGNGGSVNTVTSASFTPAGAGELIVALGSQAVGGGTWTAGACCTLVLNSGGTTDVEAEANTSGGAGAQTASITYSNSSNMDIGVGAFK